MELYGLVFGSLVAGGLSPTDMVFYQLFLAAAGLIGVCALGFVIWAWLDDSR
jgi:hypothetical protein